MSAPERWKPKNRRGELLNFVDIHVDVTESFLTVVIHAIKTGEDDFTELTGRPLVTVAASLPSASAFDEWHSSFDLDDVLNEEWYMTQDAEKLIRSAVDAGLAAVQAAGEDDEVADDKLPPLVTTWPTSYEDDDNYQMEVPC